MKLKELHPAGYGAVAGLLDDVPFNTLFARTVLDGTLPGKVYAIEESGPDAAIVLHPYGMSLLAGEPENDDFNAALVEYMLDSQAARKRPEWLQAHPQSWKGRFEEMLGPGFIPKPVPADEPAKERDEPTKVVELTRVNFRFDAARFGIYEAEAKPSEHRIIRTTGAIFNSLRGQVIPGFFWRDADHFIRDGVGFTLMADGEPASTAFCAFRSANQLELGIETAEGHRGKGYAEHVCAKLIGHCLDNGLEPVWSCRLENTGSYLLAQKLGFTPTLYIPYYRLAQKPLEMARLSPGVLRR